MSHVRTAGPGGGRQFTSCTSRSPATASLTVRVASLVRPTSVLRRRRGPRAPRRPEPVRVTGGRHHDQGRHRAGLVLRGGDAHRRPRGVRMQYDFDADRAGSASTGARWLRLARTGDTITGYESADGTTWQPSHRHAGAPTVHGGSRLFYVSSPDEVYTSPGRRRFVGGSARCRPPRRSTTYSSRRPGPGRPNSSASAADAADAAGDPGGDAGRDAGGDVGKGGPTPGSMRESGGTFTVTGTGKIGPNQPDDDMVETRPGRRDRRAHGPDRGRRAVRHLRVPARA